MSVRKHACWDLGEVKGGTGSNGLRSKGCRLPVQTANGWFTLDPGHRTGPKARG